MNRTELTTYYKNSQDFINDTIKTKYANADLGEETWEDIIARIEGATHPGIKILPLLENKRFIPGGSITASMGVPHNKDSFSNCYFIPIEEDSIEGIYQAAGRMARIFSKRGGCGTDITILRPKGTKVNNAAKTSTGAVSFIPLIAKTGEVIGQNGRRAATLVSLNIRHPDVIDFIKMKWTPEDVFLNNTISAAVMPDLSSMNVSITIPDDFMHAIENNENWDLVFPDIEDNKELYESTWNGNYEDWTGKLKVYQTIKARDLFDLWAEAAHACGDPGGLFMNTAASMAPASSIEKKLVPIGTNP